MSMMQMMRLRQVCQKGSLKNLLRGNIEYTLVKAKDLPSDLSRSIKYIYRGIETKVTPRYLHFNDGIC